jgi:xylulokinase
MVPAVVVLDASGEILRPSIQQNDARAVEEIREFRETSDEAEILRHTGSAVTQQSVGPKLRWIQKNQPEIWNRVEHVMGSYDYLNYRLTGEFAIESNWALESGLYSLEHDDWWQDMLERSQTNPTWFAPVRKPAEISGYVSKSAATETGLHEGTPVIAGSADHVASAFSAGLKDPGDLLVKLGGAGDILYVLNEYLVDKRLYIDFHVIPGAYLLNGCMAASGSIIRWFRDQFAPGQSYSSLDTAAAEINPCSDGLILLPYFLGEKTPLHDPTARGVLMGLTLSHTSAHVYRAILEGISFGFYHHLQVLNELGLGVNHTRVTNGGARSDLWAQITADVLGLPLEHIAHHPGSSLGAAFVAGVGVDQFKDWGEIDRFLEVEKTTIPIVENTSKYQEYFVVYRNLYEVNKPIFTAIRP